MPKSHSGEKKGSRTRSKSHSSEKKRSRSQSRSKSPSEKSHNNSILEEIFGITKPIGSALERAQTNLRNVTNKHRFIEQTLKEKHGYGGRRRARRHQLRHRTRGALSPMIPSLMESRK
jgi:hypothetical protein